MKCKALDYWKMIDDNWQEDADINRFKDGFDEEKAIGYRQMGEFIDNSNIFFGRDGGDLYEAIHNHIYCGLKQQYNDVEIAKMLNTYITDELELDNNNNIIYKDENKYIEDYWEFIDGFINAKLCDIQIAYDIGGKSAIKELRQNTNIDDKIYDFFLKMPTKAYMEHKLYGDDNMSDLIRLINQMSITDDENEKPHIFWTDGMTYINDEYENQFTFNSDLFDAWKLAKIFCLDFDYDASDDEVISLGVRIVNSYHNIMDTDKEVDIDKYFDDIKKDFNQLLLVDWNDTEWQQIKRHIVQCIEEEPMAIAFGGNTTFIAKWLWETINEHIGDTDEYGHRKVMYANEKDVKGAILRSEENAPKFRDNHPNQDVLRKLRDKYLQVDTYDVVAFAKALKETNKYKMDTPKDFNEYLVQSSRISYKCYELLKYLLENNIDYKQQFLVGYIDWFGDYEENERYIYCHIDSSKNEIYFQENRKSPKSAYLHDIAFPHLVFDTYRIQNDIEIKFTEQYIDDIMEEFNLTDNNRDGYIHCHMYGTVGKYTG